MKFSLLISLLFGTSSVFAAPSSSLKQQAMAESKIDGLVKSTATDAQVPGMLSLKDPRLDVVTRSWNYFAALTAQPFQSQGVVQKAGSGPFTLDNNSSTLMPGLEVGILSHAFRTSHISWNLGVRFKAGMSSQKTDITLNSGYKIEDARLNSTLLSAGPLLALHWNRWSQWALTVSPQVGSLTYTQTSANDFATFSKQSDLTSVGLGLEYAFNPQWSLFSEWTQRNLKDTREISLQKDNFELGTRITW